MSYYFVPSIVCNLAAALLSAGILLFGFLRSRESLARRPYITAMLPLIIVMALADCCGTLPGSVSFSVPFMALSIVRAAFYMSFDLLFPLLLSDLMCQTGREEALMRHRLLIWLPLSIPALTLVVILFTDPFFGIDAHYAIYGKSTRWLLVFYALPAVYLIISLRLFWEKSRRLVLFFFLLFVTWIILIANLREVALGALLCLATVILYYILPKKHGILFEIGSVLMLLLIMVVFIVDNYVSASAFTSRIESLRELETARLNEVSSLISGISAWPWFVDYWLANADALTPGAADPASLDERLAPVIREMDMTPDESLDVILELSPQEAASLSAESQHIVAGVFYDYMYEYLRSVYEKNGLISLLMVKPDENGGATILFNAADSFGDGAGYSAGTTVSMEYMEDAWQNTEQATGWVADWRWRETQSRGYLGYSIEIEGGSSGQNLILGSLITIADAFRPLSYMRSFRLRAISYMALIAVIMLLLLYNTVLKPISVLRKGIDDYQETKDSGPVRRSLALITSENEIGDMSRQFSAFTLEMDHYTGEIVRMAKEREQIHTELQLATDIQKNALLTSFPDEPAFSVFASMTPAKEVGGDFYDYIRIDEDRLAVVIADVSGKGIPAALFMMSVKIMISDRALMGGSPAEILTAVNHQVTVNNTLTSMFVTVWLGILDLRTGVMTCASAGHEYPFIRRKDGRFSFFRDPHGLVIGAIDGVVYRDYSLILAPGEAVFVYTDGVPEASDASGRFYGTERLGKALNSAHPDASAEELLAAVHRDVDRFTAGAEQFDDLTMLCLIYRGSFS